MERIKWAKQKTCHAACEQRQFTKAIQIWVEKPHVVNRRLAAAIVLGNVRATHGHVTALLKELSGQDFNINCQKQIKEFLSTQSSWQNDLDAESDGEKFNIDSVSEVKVCVRKLIPKAKINSQASDNFDGTEGVLGKDDEAVIELVVFDFSKQTVTFIPLKDSQFERYAYRFSFTTGPSESKSIDLSLPDDYLEPASPAIAITRPTTTWLCDTLLPKLAKWASEVDPDTPISSSHALISVERYSQLYVEIKKKYGPKFVKIWPENTDPQKFVYEDVAIATYILLLWEHEREEQQLQSKQSFVDLGCGNGFLVHILNSEGHPGKGIDLRSRGIWSLYGPDTNLEECSIIPSDKHLFPDADWLIGNHSDELTPWIPVMATRSSPNTRYFVLPCCFHDFAGKFNRMNSSQTQYRAYLDFVREVGEVCGFDVEEDSMRIPSTKRICQVGKRRNELSLQEQSSLDDAINNFITSRCPSKQLTKPITNFSHSSSKMSSPSCSGHLSLDGNLVISDIDKDDVDDVQVETPAEGRYSAVSSTSDAAGESDVKRNQNQTAASASTSPSSSNVSQSSQEQWAKDFQPRSKVEAVRNCSRVSNDLKERIVNDIAQAILRLGGVHIERKEDGERKVKGQKLWRRGGKMTFQEVVSLFDGNEMKQLKNECGGLKTLLKNANQVFEVSGNAVQLRDWSELPIAADSKSATKRPKGQRDRTNQKPIKSKQCWFYMHHPDGCPRFIGDCSFAHGPDDVQALPRV